MIDDVRLIFWNFIEVVPLIFYAVCITRENVLFTRRYNIELYASFMRLSDIKAMWIIKPVKVVRYQNF